MVLVACRLSQSISRPRGDPSPVLDFWLSSLRRALDEDPFWGPGFWKDIEARASTLEHGIQQLVQQCHELENRVPGNGSYHKSSHTSSNLSRQVSIKSIDLQSSKLAVRRISLTNEGRSLMQNMMLGCWRTILADATEASRRKSLSTCTILSPRLRCYTL